MGQDRCAKKVGPFILASVLMATGLFVLDLTLRLGVAGGVPFTVNRWNVGDHERPRGPKGLDRDPPLQALRLMSSLGTGNGHRLCGFVPCIQPKSLGVAPWARL